MLIKIVKSVINFSLPFLILFPTLAQSDSSKWIKPIEGTVPNPFGNGYNFYGFYRGGHTGVDILAKVGSPVVAVDNAVVSFIYSKRNMRYGNYIVLEHSNGFFTLYGHLQKIYVKTGEKVMQGQMIGTSGISGFASFPHIHFEVTNQIPVKDGAWGYNYICVKRPDSILKNKKFIDSKKSASSKYILCDFMSMPEIKDKFNFLNVYKKSMTHYYRMEKNVCVQKNINPIVYYNPEYFLPNYEKALLPDFKYHFIKKTLKDNRDKDKKTPSPIPSSNKTEPEKEKVSLISTDNSRLASPKISERKYLR